MAEHNELGKWGEEIAARYLADHGYYIKARDWRIGKRDLDIVAIRNDMLIIVEVKTRSNNDFGDPEDAITPKKIRSLRIATCAYVKMYAIDLPIQFDVFAITGTSNNYTINHIQDAFKAIFY